MVIDVKHRFDIGLIEKGLDPDKYSFELKQYHQILWSKKLPCGKMMSLSINKSKNRLEFDDLSFNPDSITHSFKNTKRKYRGVRECDIVESYKNSDPEVKRLLDDYQEIDYVIGASLIFPLKGDDGKTGYTINQARGMSYSIHDRIDYTLQCIKMYYQNSDDITNPLYKSLKRYRYFFFELFKDFNGYVDFFFLNDLLDEDGNVKSFSDVIDFDNPFPYPIEEYKKYIDNVIKFVNARSERIYRWLIDNGYSVLRY